MSGENFWVANFGPWNEINMVESRAGTSRGGHYHKHTTEAFYIIYGEIEVEIRNLENDNVELFT